MSPTPAVVIGVLLLVVIRAQDLLVLLWEWRVCLARLRAASTTMRLWSERGKETDTEIRDGKGQIKLKRQDRSVRDREEGNAKYIEFRFFIRFSDAKAFYQKAYSVVSYRETHICYSG